ncbi:hypothetical protein E1286_00535 [Nonomuraea terrae]|uniref:Uncharacterized protein n=1 Tax=Nonomuraea terrae TaxID=2530383 RepID=A0A4R4ZHR4_9ACTN|nr:hypothetical protein [Nonomuraea terrae]TDD57244.1 hypothetical protein E1286_00535 [Nonomuraea terrae]
MADGSRPGLTGKAFSQIELVRQGSQLMAEDTSFTLISGMLARDPIATGSVASPALGAAGAYARSAEGRQTGQVYAM